MTPCLAVAFNADGRRVGETHHKATLTDRDVALLVDLRDREGFTYGRLGEIFDISQSHAWRICNGAARSQLVAVYRVEPVKLVKVE
jgi:hypothetical protein